MSMATGFNPFMDDAPANPFMAIEEKAAERKEELMRLDPATGKKRKLRPNGEFYSNDPRERMLQLAEDGKVGPQFAHLSGKKKRNETAASIVAAAAAEHADAIKQVFLDGIDSSNPIGVRLQAAEKFLKVETDEQDRTLKERQAEFDQMGKSQLVGSIMEMLSDLGQAGAIAAEVAAQSEIVDADFVEEGYDDGDDD